MLLERSPLTPAGAIGKLFALQAQQPRPPFLALWARLAGFERPDLLALIEKKTLVRATFFRGTLHLLNAADYLRFRMTIQDSLLAGCRSILRDRLDGIDADKVVAAADRAFRSKPQTFGELRAGLQEQFPDVDERAMGYLSRCSLPLVMVPEDEEFCFPPDSRFVSAARWLGTEADPAEHLEELVLHYLAAFGPATGADAQTWLGLAKIKPVLEGLRDRLVVMEDEKRRELFDLPDAPRPSGKEAAPVRLLAGFDNVLLAHADRTRIIAEEHRPRVVTKNLQVLPAYLVDGFVAGTWDFAVKKKQTTVT